VSSDQLSQEFQFTYETDFSVGVLGLYYFEQNSDDVADVFLNPPPPGVQHDSDNNKVDNASWAAFTQWTFKFTDRYALTMGGRYTEDRKGSYPDQFDYSNPAIKQVPVRWYNETFSSFTPSATFAIQWNPDAMTYLSYSQGFKGGGWNSHFNAVLTPAQQAALQKFDQEDAETIEIGSKFDFGNTLRLNLAMFTSDYSNMQLTYRGPAPAGVAPFITNAGKTSIDGAEVELNWLPTEAWRVDASVGYLDATIDSLTNIPLAVLPPGLVEGNFLPYAPEWQGHLGLGYEATWGGFTVAPRLDATYQSTTYFDATNTPEIAQLDDITTVNASVRFARGADSPWNVVMGLNNATDETYPVAGNSSLTTGSGYAEVAYARPREWFVNFQYEF
jgi:iron complex outermembrane receptor protein